MSEEKRFEFEYEGEKYDVIAQKKKELQENESEVRLQLYNKSKKNTELVAEWSANTIFEADKLLKEIIQNHLGKKLDFDYISIDEIKSKYKQKASTFPCPRCDKQVEVQYDGQFPCPRCDLGFYGLVVSEDSSFVDLESFETDFFLKDDGYLLLRPSVSIAEKWMGFIFIKGKQLRRRAAPFGTSGSHIPLRKQHLGNEFYLLDLGD